MGSAPPQTTILQLIVSLKREKRWSQKKKKEMYKHINQTHADACKNDRAQWNSTPENAHIKTHLSPQACKLIKTLQVNKIYRYESLALFQNLCCLSSYITNKLPQKSRKSAFLHGLHTCAKLMQCSSNKHNAQILARIINFQLYWFIFNQYWLVPLIMLFWILLFM